MNAPNIMKGLATGLALCAALYTASPANAAETLNVGKQFKCQACHVNKLREIKKNEQPTLVAAESVSQGIHGPQEAASTQRMCLSCHDGFVLDSRFVWSEGHTTHPVGVALPATMKMAMVGDKPALPLNEDGEVYCGTCHLGHPGKDAAANAPIFIRVSRENGSLCSNCHDDKTEIAGSKHARVKKTNQPQDFESRGICGRCHAPHKNKGPLLWAKKPKEGVNTPVNGLCRSCHKKKPSPGEHPASVLAWSQPVREALIGKSALEMPVFDEQARHASRGAIGCPTCHDPHKNRADGLESDVPGYFLRLADTKGFLCADCHKSSALFRYKFFHSDKSRRR
jgi:hypothetical protein